MKILIPACGLGERFRAAGYEVVKPLVPVYGQPMIDRVVSSLQIETAIDEYFVVANWDDALDHPVIRLKSTTLGAAETVLLALQTVGTEDSSLLLLDCDAVYFCDIVSKFRKLQSDPTIRAGVLCFPERVEEQSFKPKYSYIRVDAENNVIEIAEKKRVGPLANTGAYWFASSREYLECAAKVLHEKSFQLGEAYISCVLQKYLDMGKAIMAVDIAEEEYANIGTPECLERYLQKLGPAFLFDLDGTIVDTDPAYVQAWSKLLASKGAFVDKDFFNKHISGLSDSQVRDKFKIQISSNEKDDEFLKHIGRVKEIPGARDFIRKSQLIGMVCIVTNSNKVAAIALLKHLGLDDLPLITAQDVQAGKPNPEPYAKAMRDLGVSPSKCMVFEDSRGGLISGRAARCKYIVSVSKKLSGSDAFLQEYTNAYPNDLCESLKSVSHLSVELSEMLGQEAKVYPVRASGGYISEILSASCGSRKLVLKQENNDHGVLQDVSEYLNLHATECVFYEKFARVAPLRTPMCYGVLPGSRAIVMEDLRKFDRAPAFSIESGLKVVKAIATFHSHFRGVPLGELSNHKAYMKQHVVANYHTFKMKWSSTLPPQTMKLFDHAYDFYEDAEELLLTPPCTLLHGDLKFPNLFWDTSAKGGEPIFIDWQYAGPGKGIEDIVFLLVESCESSDFRNLASTLTGAYFDAIQNLDGFEVPPTERQTLVSCALAGFPFFVAVWFGCIDATRLSEPNFPFLYIIKLANAFSCSYDVDWVRCKH